MKNKKEFYRLWYEYLWESRLYHEFLDFLSNRPGTKKKIKEPKSEFAKRNPHAGRILKFLTNCDHDSIPKKFKSRKSKGKYLILPKVSRAFAFFDHSGGSFEKFWREKQVEEDIWSQGKKNVLFLDYTYYLKVDMDFFHLEYELNKDREPTYQEFRDEFISYIKGRYPHDLKVLNPAILKKNNNTLASTLEGVKMHLSELHQKINKPGPQLGAIRRYLKVYREVKNRRMTGKGYHSKEWKEIILKVGNKSDREAISKMNENMDDVIKTYQRYCKMAERIIKNVEKGIFPGKYNMKV